MVVSGSSILRQAVSSLRMNSSSSMEVMTGVGRLEAFTRVMPEEELITGNHMILMMMYISVNKQNKDILFHAALEYI